MKKTIVEIYALLICLVAVITLSINLGLSIYSTIGIVNPSITLDSYQYKIHQNNDSFWQEQRHKFEPYISSPVNVEGTKPNKIEQRERVRPSEKILTEKRLASYQLELDSEARNNLQNLISQFIIIVISSLLLLIHWLFILRRKNDS